jgi:uncharacterized protein
MANRKALIVWGGWDGHQPEPVAEIFHKQLVNHGFEVEVSDTLDAFLDGDKLKSLDLIVAATGVCAIPSAALPSTSL